MRLGAREIELGSAVARRRFSELLKRVQNGEAIIITKRGRPVSRLAPTEEAVIARRGAAIDRLKEFGKGRTLDIPAKELIENGRMIDHAAQRVRQSEG